jgi:DNA polymerase III delta prime subunit
MTHSADEQNDFRADDAPPAGRRPGLAGRVVRWALLFGIGGWLLWTVVPAVADFVQGPDFVPLLLQMLLLGGYLLLFISFQLVLIYFFLARTRIVWQLPPHPEHRLRDFQSDPAARAAAARLILLLQGAAQSPADERLLRGLLLAGPPGVGKRTLARTIAAEAGLPLGYLHAASLSVSRVGLGPIKVLRLYRRARRLAREYGGCLLLIDQIEVLAGSVQSEVLLQIDPPPRPARWWRGILGGGQRRAAPPVLTVGITAHPTALDAALLHAGRFDRQIVIRLPDAAGRREIIAQHARRFACDLPTDTALVAETAGYTPAALRRLFYEAQMYARLEGDVPIGLTHLRQAMQSNPPSTDAAPEPAPPLGQIGQRRLAYYQAGQMYVRRRLHAPAHPPADSEPGRTRHELLREMQVSLAGRAAEEELLGIQTTRAADDLRRATRLAVLLVGAFGMGRQLSVLLPTAAEVAGADLAALPADLREQAETLLHAQYRQVRELLAHNRAAVTKLAEGVLLHEQAGEDDLSRVLAHIESRHPFVGTAADTAPHNGAASASSQAACLYARRATASDAALVALPHGVEPSPTLPEDTADDSDTDAAPPDTDESPDPPAQ